MFRNYFKIAWRTMIKNRSYSFINILGLTIGLGACMIVATVVMDDLSYDRQWSKGKELYRIIAINKMGDGLYDRSEYSFIGLADRLKSDYPEVDAVANISPVKERLKLDDKNPNGIEVNALRADTSAWNMLDFD
ncbi:MAG: ABC transporter permease, partial [Ginsengibacter sp.]